MSVLRDYLAQTAEFMATAMKREQSLERYVLEHGREYESAPLTDDEWCNLGAAIDCSRLKFPIKCCYMNSQRLGGYAPNDLRYVEGWVWPHDMIPIAHAWLDLNGKVVDVTLRMAGKFAGRRKYWRKVGRLPSRNIGEINGADYFGAIIPWPAVYKCQLTTKTYTSVLDDWQNGWPLLQAVNA